MAEEAQEPVFIEYVPDPTVVTTPSPAVVTSPGHTTLVTTSAQSLTLNPNFPSKALNVEQSASSFAFTNNPTFTGTVTLPEVDQTSNDNTAATTSFCKTLLTNKLNALVSDAPQALDTLNELAAAINDDANFGSAVTTSLAARYTKTETDNLLSSKLNTTALNNTTFTGTTTMVDARVTGTLTTPAQYYALWLINAGATPVEPNTYTSVPWGFCQASRGGNQLWDNANQRFVLPVAGVWRIDFSVVFASTAALNRMILQMKVNNTVRADFNGSKASTIGGLNMSTSLLVNANDYVELQVHHSNTTVTNLPTTGGFAMAYRDRAASPATYAIFTFLG